MVIGNVPDLEAVDVLTAGLDRIHPGIDHPHGGTRLSVIANSSR